MTADVVAADGVDFSDPVEAEVALRIAIAWRELRRGASTQRLREYFTTPEALDQGRTDTLDVLTTRSAWRMSELAEALRVDPSTATRAVQRLVDIGLAERNASIDDARVVLVSASATGRRRARQIRDRRIIAMSRILGGFDAEERAVLAGLMERFVGQIDRLVAELAELDDSE